MLAWEDFCVGDLLTDVEITLNLHQLIFIVGCLELAFLRKPEEMADRTTARQIRDFLIMKILQRFGFRRKRKTRVYDKQEEIKHG